MNFTYFNEGDQLHQTETYKFTRRGKVVAEIELMILFNNDTRDDFAYNVTMGRNIPSDMRSFTSSDSNLKKDIGADTKAIFTNRQDALQDAVNVISKIIESWTISK